jgi:peptidoglycan glycosyltransferase
MPFLTEIRRLTLGMVACFGAIIVAAAYWGWVVAPALLSRDDNPRLIEAETRIDRGRILDRHGRVLAESIPDNDRFIRRYAEASTAGLIGYYSLRYGTAGLELMFDSTLRGDSAEALTLNALIHQPIRGSDVLLTLDLDIQQALFRSMSGSRGAAFVISVPDGSILAAVSVPSFDPNLIDLEFDALRVASEQPLFNRALQGRYQPGSVNQTALIIGALLQETPLDFPNDGATMPVVLQDMSIGCSVRLPDIPLDLRESYAFACPQAFVTLGTTLGEPVVESLTQILQHLASVTLTSGTDTSAVTSTLSASIPDSSFEAVILGQNGRTVTPLGMALLAAAVANDGLAPYPAIVQQIVDPNGMPAPDPTRQPGIPVTTATTARRLQDLMRFNVVNGAAQNAGRPSLDIGGHAALAQTGARQDAWFIGFVTLGGRQAVAIAIVLEDTNDVGLAADIAGATLSAAQQSLALTN